MQKTKNLMITQWTLMPRSNEPRFSSNTFAMPLLEWHLLHGRSLPWMTRQPYDVWLSEVMLQQTQVATVLERYSSFKVRFPTIQSLALADVEDVLAQWSGLGYYRRARNLHACAQQLVMWLQTHADWPQEAHEWVAFPGIGQSTANAIVSACFDKVAPILDANAKRVLLRFSGKQEAGDKEAWNYAHLAMNVPSEKAAQYTQAMMDLGATVCMARAAHCLTCPLATNCKSVGWKKEITPRTAPKEKAASKRMVVFDWVLCLREVNGDVEVLLQQRDASSFWPELWVLPGVDERFSFVEKIEARQLKHELSHRSLRINVKVGTFTKDLQTNERWVSLRAIAERTIAVPSPVQALTGLED